MEINDREMILRMVESGRISKKEGEEFLRVIESLETKSVHQAASPDQKAKSCLELFLGREIGIEDYLSRHKHEARKNILLTLANALLVLPAIFMVMSSNVSLERRLLLIYIIVGLELIFAVALIFRFHRWGAHRFSERQNASGGRRE